jgi:aminoglycoside phosphotransferase (APT) family kinase protein
VATPAVYPFIDASHPFHARLEGFRARIAADPGLAGAVGVGTRLRGGLRARPDPDGRWRIERFYWCAQWWEPGASPRFCARTLLYDVRHGEAAEIYDFPRDPRLRAASEPGSPLAAAGVEVLRYIPLQRLTFRTGDTVGKMKRPASVRRSFERLGVVAEAARRAEASFAVPARLGLDTKRSMFFQELVAGPPVAELLCGANADELLRALGSVHREIHELSAPRLPARPMQAVLDEARDDLAWIGFVAPPHAGALRRVERWLEHELGASAGAADAVCHGDFDPSHVLAGAGRWAVIDFDDATVGDPYAELGTMLALLRHDAPELRLRAGPGALARARASYLAGYAERAGIALVRRRLAAQRVRAEVALLASRLRKGFGDGEQIDRWVARLQELCRA